MADVLIDDWSYPTWAGKVASAGSHEHHAYLMMQHLLSTHAPLPDVVLSTDDTATRGIITALRQAGIQPGRDLTIISSANAGAAMLESYAHEVTCITFDPAAIAGAALHLLATLTAGGTPPRNPVLIAPVLMAQTAVDYATK